MNTQWIEEFGTAYAVPDVVATDARLIDVSWHNDASPSFTDARMDQDYDQPRLWVQHPEPGVRDCGPDGPRFAVSGVMPDGEIGTVWEGEDAAEAVAALLAVIDTCPHPESAYRFSRDSRNACESCSRCGVVLTPRTPEAEDAPTPIAFPAHEIHALLAAINYFLDEVGHPSPDMFATVKAVEMARDRIVGTALINPAACPHDEADRLIEATPNNVYVTCRACGAVLQA